MPHSTIEKSPLRASSVSRASVKLPPEMRAPLEKFPDHVDQFSAQNGFRDPPAIAFNSKSSISTPSTERWLPRKENASPWKAANGRSHGRQKSLGDAIRTIRTRGASVSENAREVADALKAPVSPKLIILCVVWYLSSALTNTSSKSILNAFPKPATLTLVQFGFVASFCLFFSWLSSVLPGLKNAIPALRHGIRYPTQEIIMTTIPMAAFQIGGHLLSSTATSKIPVSLVHTIKGLSPLFTVFAYRVIFDIRYPIATYLSLIPLTLGVILACSTEFRGNIFGIFCAFLAAIIFVTQNIFSKRLFNEAAKAEADGHYVQSRKLDKLNLLCYSSGLAFVLTSPIWFWSEGLTLLSDFFHDGSLDLTDKPESFDHGRLAIEFIFNGTFHFGQNIIAFVLLSMVSPVTYSVASLIKRVFVVVISIIWFQYSTTPIQAVGIGLTFFGLYLYDRTSDSNKADRKARMLDIKEEALLPLNTSMSGGPSSSSVPVYESPHSTSTGPYGVSNGFVNTALSGDTKRGGEERTGRSRAQSNVTWMPPGTKAEETWRPRDGVAVS